MTDINVGVAVAASVATFAVGAAGSYILTKKYVSAQYDGVIDEEIKKAKEYYQTHTPVEEEDIPDGVVEEVTEVVAEIEVGALTQDQNKLKEDYISYDKIATKYGSDHISTKPAAKVAPRDGESMEQFEQRLIDEAKSFVQTTLADTGNHPGVLDDIEEEEEELVTTNIFEKHGTSDDYELDLSNVGSDRPYIISNEMFEDSELQYNQNTLTYYQGDRVLVDEKDQPIPIKSVVGESNLKFGSASGDLNLVYIRNEKLEVDFEILRSYGSYSEEVLGVPARETKRKS